MMWKGVGSTGRRLLTEMLVLRWLEVLGVWVPASTSIYQHF
jgi:hypothetical protein